MIDRRMFLYRIAWLALPAVARAQPKEKLRRIGWLSAFPRSDVDAGMKLMRPELERLGWIEGRTITLLEPRILRGADPAKLAIEQPAKFALGINLVSAKALGLEISASLLARADQVNPLMATSIGGHTRPRRGL